MKNQNLSASLVRFVKAVCTYLLFLSLAMIISGCGNWILRADFNNYIPESNILAGPLPGNPDEDRIDNVEPPVRVHAGSPNNIVQVGESENSGRIEFVTAPHDPPEQYRIDWDGHKVTVGTGNTFIAFIDDDGTGNSNRAFMLRFSVNQLVVLINGNEDIIHPITFSHQQSHAILIVIHMDNQKSVDIRFEENGNVINRTFDISQNFTSLTSMVIDAQPFGDYQIADLDIYARGSL